MSFRLEAIPGAHDSRDAINREKPTNKTFFKKKKMIDFLFQTNIQRSHERDYVLFLFYQK